MAQSARERKAAQRRREREAQSVELGDRPAKPRPVPKGLGLRSTVARRYWRSWAGERQSKRFLDTDWLLLERAALLVDDFVAARDAGERDQALRIAKVVESIEDRLGGSAKARHQLKWNFLPAGEEPRAEPEAPPKDGGDAPAGVVSMDEWTTKAAGSAG